MAQRPRSSRSSSRSSGRSSGARRPAGRSGASSGGSRRSSGGSRGSSGSSRRSSAGRGRRSGGGSNATAIGVGVVLLIGVVVIVMVSMNNKKKNKLAPKVTDKELTSDSQVNASDLGPKQPERPPPPEISPEILQDAKDVVAEAKIEAAKGDALYAEAMAAKNAGDEDTWQTKLQEAREHYVNIRDMWNSRIEEAIINELPMGCQWEADEVANHWIGKEAGKITKMLGKIGMITKQTRMK